MSIEHRVQRGDCVASLAAQYGLPRKVIWDDNAENAELRQRRDKGYLLDPEADTVSIPEREPKEIACACEARHRFVLRMERVTLRLRLLEEDNPKADLPFQLTIDDTVIEGMTDGEGQLTTMIPAGATSAQLTVDPEGSPECYVLSLGDLDPMDSVRGAQARLKNLSFYGGELDGVLGEQTREGIERFQAHEELPVTGKLNAATLDKLEASHGC